MCLESHFGVFRVSRNQVWVVAVWDVPSQWKVIPFLGGGFKYENFHDPKMLHVWYIYIYLLTFGFDFYGKCR